VKEGALCLLSNRELKSESNRGLGLESTIEEEKEESKEKMKIMNNAETKEKKQEETIIIM